MRGAFVMLAAFCLDLCIGDPRWLPHPVRGMGRAIGKLEGLLRRSFPATPGGERAAGAVLAAALPLGSFGAGWALLRLCEMVSPWLALLAEIFLCSQCLAARDLKQESMAVYARLVRGDLPAARQAVGRIVGRDTAALTAEGVTKAAVETVAENTSDGIIAPMLYMLVGGAALGFFYKAVNTMDSMVGYKNDKYLYFGRAAALFDDVLNYIPARVSAYMMILASSLCGLDGKKAYEIYKRDRYNHASPNSAHTEAVMAGALHVQLAGDAWYFGVLHEKKTIGDPDRAVVCEDIPLANRLLYMTAVISLLIFGCVKGLLILIF